MILILMFSIFAGATIVAFSLRAIYSIGIISITKGCYLTLLFAMVLVAYTFSIYAYLIAYETFKTNTWILALICIAAIIIPSVIVSYVTFKTALFRSSNGSKFNSVVAKLSGCKIKDKIDDYIIFYFNEEQIDRVIRRIKGRKDV